MVVRATALLAATHTETLTLARIARLLTAAAAIAPCLAPDNRRVASALLLLLAAAAAAAGMVGCAGALLAQDATAPATVSAARVCGRALSAASAWGVGGGGARAAPLGTPALATLELGVRAREGRGGEGGGEGRSGESKQRRRMTRSILVDKYLLSLVLYRCCRQR